MDRIDQIRSEIEKIDKKFEDATGWGSWMASASGRRKSLVREAAVLGVVIEPRYVFGRAD